jgi:thiosulfate/3-mercaptopyruvate sulfurtransferase
MPAFASPDGNTPRKTGLKEINQPEINALLTEPADLHKRLNDTGLRILDTRAKADYAKGHIPGAVWVDVPAWQKLGKANAGFRNAQAWSDQVGRLGVSNGTRVVVYGSRLPETARVWWTLKYLGNEDTAILNGGWEAWLKEGRPVTTAIPEVTQIRFEPRFQAGRLEEIDALKQAVRAEKAKVVDTRSADEFTGKEVRGKQGGHIPHATHLEWKELLAKDGRFKTREELRELFRKRGILPDDTAVCY